MTTEHLMTNHSSMFAIIYQSGWLAIGVLLVLLLMSVISWAIILRKWRYVARFSKKAGLFLRGVDFENGIADIRLRTEQHPDTYTNHIFQSAYRAFSGSQEVLRGAHANARLLSQSIERNIEKTISEEKSQLEKELSVLATISSSAPFIGLLGTVIGIIDAFYSIAAQGASSIAVVAPGISGALVATAVGLFTAIPALIAYNVFREKARALSNEMNRFGLEVMSLLEKSKDEELAEDNGKFPEIRLGKG